MPRRLKLEPHLSAEELKRRFKNARDPLEMRRWQVLYLLSQGWLTRAIAESTTYHPQTIRTIVWRYNSEGPGSIHDKRRTSSRRQPPLLNPAQLAQLAKALTAPPPSGEGGWTGAEVARWMSDELGRQVSPQRGWDYLQKARRNYSEDS